MFHYNLRQNKQTPPPQPKGKGELCGLRSSPPPINELIYTRKIFFSSETKWMKIGHCKTVSGFLQVNYYKLVAIDYKILLTYMQQIVLQFQLSKWNVCCYQSLFQWLKIDQELLTLPFLASKVHAVFLRWWELHSHFCLLSVFFIEIQFCSCASSWGQQNINTESRKPFLNRSWEWKRVGYSVAHL